MSVTNKYNIINPLEGSRTPILRTGILCVIHYTTRGEFNNTLSVQILIAMVNNN